MPATAIDETQRQHALDHYHILDSLPSGAYDDIVRLASTLCGTPIALVSLIDRDRQWFKARIGIDVPETSRDIAFCNQAIAAPDRLMEVSDLAQDPRFADNPFVTGDFAARFYAGMPLVTPEGAAIGTVCVLDRAPRTLDAAQREALETLARLTMHLIEAHGRERTLERGAVLQEAVAAAPATARAELARAYTVAIVELQDFAGVVERIGERATEKALQHLDEALDPCLRIEDGDVISRATGSPEAIAVLQGAAAVDTAQRLRDAAAAYGRDHGVRVLVGTAASTADEPMERAFLRADQALSAEKDALRATTH